MPKSDLNPPVSWQLYANALRANPVYQRYRRFSLIGASLTCIFIIQVVIGVFGGYPAFAVIGLTIALFITGSLWLISARLRNNAQTETLDQTQAEIINRPHPEV